MTKAKFKIDGMHCTSCAMSIDLDLEELEGVKSARTSYAKQVTEVEFDEGKVTSEEVAKVIEKLGYHTSPVVD